MNDPEQSNMPPLDELVFKQSSRVKGLTEYLKNMKVGEVAKLAPFKQSSVPAVARNLGMKFATSTDNSNEVYIKRLS